MFCRGTATVGAEHVPGDRDELGTLGAVGASGSLHSVDVNLQVTGYYQNHRHHDVHLVLRLDREVVARLRL